MVTESASPVGRGTVGLLLIKGIPSSPASSAAAGGLFVGEFSSLEWKGQVKSGELVDTTPPGVGAGAAGGDDSGGKAMDSSRSSEPPSSQVLRKQ